MTYYLICIVTIITQLAAVHMVTIKTSEMATYGHPLGFLFFEILLRPDFLYSLVYDNFFQRSNVGGWNKNKNKMSQNKVISILNMK